MAAPTPPPPPAPPAPGSQQNFAGRAWSKYRSWPLWAQALVALLLLSVIVAAAAGGGEEANDEAVAADETTTTTTEDEGDPSTTTEATTTTTEATTTTTEPPTTTTTTPPPQPIVLEGSGDFVAQFDNPGASEIQWATITHSGGSNFAVWELGEDLQQGDLLVNTVGNYQGNVAVGVDIDVHGFEITADGPWRIEVKPLEMLRAFDSTAEGAGDDVLRYDGEAMAARISHAGSSNFAVWANNDLLVNEVGNYDGTVRFPAGPALVRITADGPWSIAPG